MYCNKSSTKECPYSGNRIKNIKKNSLVPDKLRPNFQKTYSLKIQRRGINMKWTDILKAPEWKDDVVRKTMRQAESLDEDLYALPEDKVKNIPTVCGSLREAMENLDRDRGFLKQGGVFTDDQIDAYIALKFEEIHKFEHAPHPVEFDMYYSS